MEKFEIDAYVKAGEIAKEIKKFARDLIKPGIKLIDIANAIDSKILELGGEPAFPVNLGVNEVAAHYTPESNDETIAEGILKVDLGIAVEGYIADTAFSVDLTKDKRFEEMIKLNKKILAEASEVVKIGMEVRDIGESCQNNLKEWNEKNDSNFSIIRSLSGHALDKNIIHTNPTISNYKNDNHMVLDDIAFAIEPFVTTGVGDIYEGAPGGIYVLKNLRNVRDREAKLILKFIRDNYKTRPFCARWLKKAGESMANDGWSVTKLGFVLRMLVKQDILYEYPMLIEKSRAPVSQFENTFLITRDEVLCTTG